MIAVDPRPRFLEFSVRVADAKEAEVRTIMNTNAVVNVTDREDRVIVITSMVTRHLQRLLQQHQCAASMDKPNQRQTCSP